MSDASSRQIDPARVRRRLSRLAEVEGLARRLTPHVLRHISATPLAEADVNMRCVQRLLGHAGIAATQICAHVSACASRGAIVRADTCRPLRVQA